MPKKLTILGALTVAVVMGLFGLNNTSTNTEGAIQSFSISGVTEIDWHGCYDTVAANTPVLSGGRVVCNASNPTTLPSATTVTHWSLINLPRGNRLTLPITFTPMDAGEFASPSIACFLGGPTGNNECDAGTATGTVTARPDVACNDVADVLARSTSPGPGGAWPDESNWTPFGFTRIGASVANGGNGEITSGDNAYIHDIVPFPTTGAAAWTFSTADLSLLDTLWLGGTIPIDIDPVTRLQLVSYVSTFAGQTGLSASVALLGGSPDGVPTDNTQLCLDSPQDSSGKTIGLITPTGNRVIPRWTIFTSDLDDGDASVDTILDWECYTVGTGETDSDGDCYPDGTEPDACEGPDDCDADGVPDGIELYLNSNIQDTDSDNDGSDDYSEMFNFTDPNDTDTDNDLQADKLDDTPTKPLETSDAADATDDNCPNVPNHDVDGIAGGTIDGDPNRAGDQLGQINTDSNREFHGMGVGTGDATNPTEDIDGDACDTDDDNDFIGDVGEVGLDIQGWGGYTTAPTSVCVGPGLGSDPDMLMDPWRGDEDHDYILSGRECSFRSRPDVSIRSGAGAGAMNCGTAGVPIPPAGVVFADGCAQPGSNSSGTGGGDADSDGLFKPGDSGAHCGLFSVEVFYRTENINDPAGGQENDIDGDLLSGCTGAGDRDSDRDLLGITGTTASLQDGNEVKIYGTNPATADTDQDGCPDADEIYDINGDGATSSGDQGLMASRFPVSPLDNAPANGEIDDYADMDIDLNKDGALSSGDQGTLAAAISAPGTCSPFSTSEDNFDVGRATKPFP
jgi:hypothetical protein